MKAASSAGGSARSDTMIMRKTIRTLGVSLALLALLLFSTVVVSDFDCHSADDDARCPYCHLSHQAPAEPEITQCVSVLEPVALLPPPEDTTPVVVSFFSQTAPRGPPLS
jgi:hypothetical protein